MLKQGFLLILMIILTACAVGPEYKAPKSSLTNYRWSTHSNQLVTDYVERKWWQQLADPQLSQYVEAIESNNLDVGIACKRLLQARAIQQADYARGGPKLSAKASVTNEEISRNGRVLGLFPKSPFFQTVSLNRKVYEPGFDASWELDVFGQNLRRNQQRSAQSIVAAITVNDVIRQLRAEVARAYIQLRIVQHKIDITKKNVDLQKKTLFISHQRLDAGSNNELDVALAKSQYKSTKAGLPQLQGELYQYASQIAILLGKTPSSMVDELLRTRSMPTIPNKVAVGLPSDLLRRRPDIIAAERNIAAATAAIGVAVADLYPKFNLVANYSLESLALDTLWRRDSSVWVLGPFMQWAIFQSGQIRANIKLKQAEQQEAIIHYQKAVLSALQEAETAIQTFHRSQQAVDDYQKAVSANHNSVKLAKERYLGGEDDILSVIQSQQGLLQAQTNQIDAQLSSLIQLVHIYKAVGGGWIS